MERCGLKVEDCDLTNEVKSIYYVLLDIESQAFGSLSEDCSDLGITAQ